MKEWRLVRDGKADAFRNMGTDEAILDAVGAGKAPPTFRLYTWRPSAVSIGRFQAFDEVVDASACRELGIDIVRRISGGGSVFHDEKGEVTYSMVVREEDIPAHDVIDSFKYLLGTVVVTLKALGLRAEFAPINDVVVRGKKISGSAQVRRNGTVLQHGTVLMNMEKEVAFKVLRVPRLKVEERGLPGPAERVTTLAAEGVHIDASSLYQELVVGFSAATGAELRNGRISEEELEAAKAYARRRYADPAWLESR
ncbi:MAG: biotin/lipoate A/B protein ligase family protein [Conexivisphaerales archaeon]|jgi:lipoate-protein ligase A